MSGTPSGEAIVPRWEWRTFGPRFERADERLAALTPGAVQESDELYFLSGTGGTAKVRAGLMDIKVLYETNGDGLEHWKPIMKAEFPLPAADVKTMFEALEVNAPPLTRDQYTQQQLLDELVSQSGVVRAVQVHKKRYRYSFSGCMAELVDVVADGRSGRTIAIETEDAAAVIAAVRELGLGNHLNTCYPRGLHLLIDDVAPRYAVIDVGTNSVKFHVGERAADGTWRTISDRAEITRLGEGLEERGEIAPDGLDRTTTAIEGMVAEAKREDVRELAAVGTAGLRIATNSASVLDAIQSKTGVTVEVIPGEEEGRLAYLAVKTGLGLAEGSLAVFDTGGGSTQFTFGHGDRVDEQFSVEVGAVRYTERFGLGGAVTPDVLRETKAAIAADLSSIDGHPEPDALVAMGGAVTNITAVKHALATYDPDIVQGTVLDLAEIDRQIELYRSLDTEARREIVGLQPKRADVILAGACIVRTIMDKLQKNALTVSDRGLRHGLLIERFGRP